MKKLIRVFFALVALLAALRVPAASAEAEKAKLTLMIYMCGSNLESAYGSATADLQEMLASGCDFSRVNVLVMAGGTARWDLGLDTSALCVYRLTERGLRPVWRGEAASMGEAQTLTRLLDLGAERFPAKDYALILWNHGGGPLGGVCWDELFSMDNLTLSELTDALSASRLPGKLSWIGFDACLMGSVEVADALSPFAKVMIASQETEPAPGWNYAFLKGIEDDADGAATGRRVIDAFFESLEGSGEALTLSCVDLEQVFDVTHTFSRFFSSVSSKLNDESFPDYSIRRMQTVSFGRAVDSSGYDLVDLSDLVRNYGGDAEVSKALDGAVIYCRSTDGSACGLSVYHPYGNVDMFESRWKEDYGALNFNRSYANYLSRFEALLAGGEQADWSGLETVDEGFDEQDGQRFSLRLTEEQREALASAQLYILQPSFGYSDGVPVALAAISVEDVEIGPDGLLTGSYDWRSLYVVNDGGAPLLGPVSFRRDREDYYSILTHYEGYTGPYPDRDATGVLYDCAAVRGADELAVEHTYVFDSASQSFTNRIPFSEAGYGSVFFHESIYSPPPFEGVIPGFGDWDTFLGYRMTSVSLPCSWRLRFMDERLHSGPLYATFQLTDVHQNTFSSIPVRFDPPGQIDIPVTPERLEIDGQSAWLTATLDLALESPLLRLELRIENQTDETLDYHGSYEVPMLVINGEREPISTLAFGNSYDIAPGGSILATVELDCMDLANLQSVDSIDINLTRNPSGSYSDKTLFSLRFGLEGCDVSAFAKTLDHIARTEQDGVVWQLLSLSVDEDSLDALLYVENNGDAPLDCNLKAGVEDVFFGNSSNSASVAPRHNGFARVSQRNGATLSSLSLDVENLTHFTMLPDLASMNDMLARNGVTAITSLDLLQDFTSYNPIRRVELDLDEPIPVPPPRGGGPALTPLVSGAFSASLESVFVADDGLALGLSVRNDSDALLTAREYTYAFNGSDEALMPKYTLFNCTLPPRSTCFDWLVIEIDEGLAGHSLSELSLSLLVDDQPQQRFSIQFPEGTAFGEPGGTYIPAEALAVLPVDYQVRPKVLVEEIEMPEGPVEPLVLNVPMAEEDLLSADFAEALICVRQDGGDDAVRDDTPLRIITSTPVKFGADNRPVAKYLGVALLADEDLLRIVETYSGSETWVGLNERLYFFHNSGEFSADPHTSLSDSCPDSVRLSLELTVREEGGRLTLAKTSRSLFTLSSTNTVDLNRDSFTIDELPLYAAQHHVYHFIDITSEGSDLDYYEQQVRELDAPLELSVVPIDSLRDKLYLLLVYGTDESPHYLLLNPDTMEVLLEDKQ